MLTVSRKVDRRVDRLRRCCGGKGTIAELYRATFDEPYTLVCCACAREIGVVPARVAEQLARWLAAGRLSGSPVLQDDALRP